MDVNIELSKEARRRAKSVEAVINLLDIDITANHLLLRVVEDYGNEREKDGIRVGKLLAEKEYRNTLFRLASFQEQRNKDLLRDVIDTINEYNGMQEDFDEVPF